jgi:hypothetical protein
MEARTLESAMAESDAVLVAAARRDARAFLELYDRYVARCTATGLPVLGSSR